MAFINLGPTTPQEYRYWLKVYQEAVESHEKELSEKREILSKLDHAIEWGDRDLLATLFSGKELEILSDILGIHIAKQEASRDKCKEMVDEIQTYLNNLAQAESEEE